MNYKHINAFCRRNIDDFLKASDGQRTFNDAAEFVETDKWNNFSQFHKTHSNIADKYVEAGLKSGLYKMQTGSDIGTGRWIIDQCEDISSATLELLGKNGQMLADFKKSPWSVVQWTASTPKAGITAELVAPTDEKIKKLKRRKLLGKFVLLNRFDRTKVDLLAKAGACGVIFDVSIPNNPDAQGWVKFGWGSQGLAHSSVHLLGMVISANQGAMLRQKLSNDETLRLKMKISARHYSGSHEMAWGLLEGALDPQQEVWAISHSAEPGAVDNASGVAVCIEALRILQKLISSGKLAPPRRSIRMLSGFECYSFFNYMENTRRLHKPVAGICVDSVGTKPEVSNGRLDWRKTIPMSGCFVNRVGNRIFSKVFGKSASPHKLIEGCFISTLDTLAGDPKYGFPCPWITSYLQKEGQPYDAYHSSADTMELLCPGALAATAAALAGYCYYLANADENDIFEMAQNETEAAIKNIKLIKPASNRNFQAQYIIDNHKTTLDSLKPFALGSNAADITRNFNNLEDKVKTAASKHTSKTTTRKVDKKYHSIPLRKIPIVPTMGNSPESFNNSIKDCKLANWALYWADGKRDIFEITNMLCCEYKREVDTEQVYSFFAAHADLGYVKLFAPDEIITSARILKDLKKLGVKAGMNLLIHSSLSSLGMVAGGAETIVETLVKAVGKSGTVMVPTFNHMQAKVFNPSTTPGLNGAIAEALWKDSRSFRSDHTTHAVAAIGKRAEEFCKDHTANGLWTENSPLGKLMNADGYVLCLGVDQIYSTHYHLAEVAMGNCIDPKGSVGKFVDSDGKLREVPTLAYRNGTCPSHPRTIGQLLDQNKLRTKVFVGNAESTLAKAADIYSQRVEMLKKFCNNCKIKPDKTK